MATAGTFDGVHRGHRYALRLLADRAAAAGLRPMVVTFEAHPMHSIAPGKAPAALTTAAEKERLLRESVPGIEVVTLPFDSIRGMTGADFAAMLHDRFGVEALAMGFNNHIGCDRATEATLAASSPIPVSTLPECPLATSSSAVRAALAEGDVARAAVLLDRPYSYTGTVVHGRALGRTIGFPTANIESSDPSLMLPARGVYAVDAILADGSRHRAMANIGHRPTVDSDTAPDTFEVHIIDCDADLYGQTVRIDFLARLRDEQRFDSIDELKEALDRDRHRALALRVSNH